MLLRNVSYWSEEPWSYLWQETSVILSARNDRILQCPHACPTLPPIAFFARSELDSSIQLALKRKDQPTWSNACLVYSCIRGWKHKDSTNLFVARGKTSSLSQRNLCPGSLWGWVYSHLSICTNVAHDWFLISMALLAILKHRVHPANYEYHSHPHPQVE